MTCSEACQQSTALLHVLIISCFAAHSHSLELDSGNTSRDIMAGQAQDGEDTQAFQMAAHVGRETICFLIALQKPGSVLQIQLFHLMKMVHLFSQRAYLRDSLSIPLVHQQSKEKAGRKLTGHKLSAHAAMRIGIKPLLRTESFCISTASA